MSQAKQHPPILFATLQPEFIKLANDTDAAWVVVDHIEDAQGVRFLCPLCFHRHRGHLGTHRVICWSRSRGVPDILHPKPGRWKLKGAWLAELTLDPDPAPPEPGQEVSNSRSVRLIGSGCGWHGFVTGGLVTAAE